MDNTTISKDITMPTTMDTLALQYISNFVSKINKYAYCIAMVMDTDNDITLGELLPCDIPAVSMEVTTSLPSKYRWQGTTVNVVYVYAFILTEADAMMANLAIGNNYSAQPVSLIDTAVSGSAISGLDVSFTILERHNI